MKLKGSEKQIAWANKILAGANLTTMQTDNLLRWGGPTMAAAGICDAVVVIEHRHNLAEYADALGEFYKLSAEGKRTVAQQAACLISRAAKRGGANH